MTGADDTVFLDTNVLVYANVKSAPLHNAALQTLDDHWNAGVELWISRQVIREYIVALTRPQSFGRPRSIRTVIERARYFEQRLLVAEDGPNVTEKLFTLLQEIKTGGKQIHDANIVATMLTYGIKHLLTQNVADFKRFASYITILPLET